MRGAEVGHVDFMLFVSISFAFVTQHKSSFQWNMGLKDSKKIPESRNLTSLKFEGIPRE